MGKKRRKIHTGPVPIEQLDSDDERAYEKESVPDPKSSEYYYDEIDDFHEQQDKVLLDSGVQLDTQHASDSEEEVLGLGVDSDDDDSDEEIATYKQTLRRVGRIAKRGAPASDEEDVDPDEGLPDSKAWGSFKNRYYGADIHDDEIDVSEGDDELEGPGVALLEEAEALALQKRLAEQLDDEDFGIDLIKKAELSQVEGEGEKIEKDLSQMSRRQKLQLLRKESPEFLELIKDFTTKMMEVRDQLLPLHQLIRSGAIPQSTASEFVQTKLTLNLNYCVNVSFYVQLKATLTPVHNHPVIRRILQYRNLLKQLDPMAEQLQPQMQAILAATKQQRDVTPLETPARDTNAGKMRSSTGKVKAGLKHARDAIDNEKQMRSKKSTLKGTYETTDERQALKYYVMLKGGRTDVNENDSNMESDDDKANDKAPGADEEMPEAAASLLQALTAEEEDGDGKRAITYQMEKNKGVKVYKKKELRNPRVKHRRKYEKAKIRRRGMVREVRKEMAPYGGELFGIRAGVKRSIQLK